MNRKKFYKICRTSCKFYKPVRKTQEHCYGFDKVIKFIEERRIEISKVISLDFTKFNNKNDRFLNEHLCKYCPFLKDGCDFCTGKGNEPCGGYKIFDILLSKNVIKEDLLKEEFEHYSLSEHSFLKILEMPFIYSRKADELYEIDREGTIFLKKFLNNNISSLNNKQKKFVNSLKKEKLIVKNRTETLTIPTQSPIPSLRYLELQLTKKCNLKCKHCYLGRAENIELPLEKAKEVVKSFETLQGLKLLVSGGEPLLYSKFKEFNEFLKDTKLRRVLITNGVTLSKVKIGSLNFDEVQVSVDGMEWAHNKLRGKGSYQKTMEGIKKLRKVDIDLSVATMITNYNLNDFKNMHKMFKKLKVKSWGIDLPCVSGYLKENPDIIPSPEVAAKLMRYSFGGGYHGSDGAFICGNHLLTVSPDGNVAKCGFYFDTPYGNIYKENLEKIWGKASHIPVTELKDCAGCKFIETCMGGCRFRADSPYGRDSVMCYFYGNL